MAVEFISSKLPPWKAIQSRLKTKQKPLMRLRINLNTLHQRELGPGCYTITEKIPKKNSGPKFSTLPRFSPTEKFKLIVPNFSRPASQLTVRGPENEKKDKKSGVFHMNMYKKRFKSADSVGKFKNLILKSRTEEKIRKIQEKNDRFARWNAAKKIVAAQKGWNVFLVMVSVARSIRMKIKIKKKFKSAFMFNSTLLYQVSRVVGNLRIKLKRIKRANSIKVLSSLLIPYIHSRTDRLLKNYQKLITSTLELCLTRRMIKRLFLSLGRKMMRLELKLIDLVKIYKSRKEMLMKMWSMIESKYHQYSNKKLVPAEISEKVIRKYLFGKLKQYFFEQKEYRESQKMFKKELKKVRKESPEMNYRKKGWRVTFAVKAFPIFRIYHQDEMIRLYLEEEHKLN